nr:serine hydrolase [Corynebacterium lactis]
MAHSRSDSRSSSARRAVPRRGLAAGFAIAALLAAAPAVVPADGGGVGSIVDGDGSGVASRLGNIGIAPYAHAQTSSAKTSSDKESSTAKTSSESSSATTTAPKSTTTATPTAALKPAVKTKWGEGVQQRMDAATKKLESDGSKFGKPSKIGIGILDRKTGEFLCNAHCNEAFELASLSKVFVADVVAYSNYTPPKDGKIKAGSGDMPVDGNQDAMARDDMIRYSDNEATDLLWSEYGQTAIIDSVKERYGLSDATQSNPDWGMTQSSPADMVHYFDGMLSGKGELPDVETRYLRQLMYSLPRYSYGNADQNIGLRAALPKEMVANKSGWFDPEIRTTAGFFGEGDRYAIAVLGSYINADDLTDTVAQIFPAGEASTSDDDASSSRPVSMASDNRGPSANPAVWALVAAILGFSLGWIVRKQTAE